MSRDGDGSRKGDGSCEAERLGRTAHIPMGIGPGHDDDIALSEIWAELFVQKTLERLTVH